MADELRKTNNTPTNEDGTEKVSPSVSARNDTPTKGNPTTPSIAIGYIPGTTIDELNNSLSHVCDFTSDLKKSIGLKKLIKAIAKYIREGIRAIQRALGFSDSSGSFSEIINMLKAVAEFINYVNKEFIQPVIDFEKYVLAVLVKVRATIQWILSLPAKFIKLLADCLQKMYNAISSIFSDALTEAAAEVPLGGGTPTVNGIGDALKQLQVTLGAGQNLLKSTAQATALGVGIAASATVGLVTPVSAADLTNANKVISNYESTTPTVAQSGIAAPVQKKSTP